MDADVVNYAGEIVLSYKSPRKKLKLPALESDTDVVVFARKVWPKDILIRERLLVLLLNNKLSILAHFWLGAGGIGTTIGDIRLLNFVAVSFTASSVVMIHNHPSMIMKASRTDKELTHAAMKSLNTLGVLLTDHIIITPYDHFSMRTENQPLFENQKTF